MAPRWPRRRASAVACRGRRKARRRPAEPGNARDGMALAALRPYPQARGERLAAMRDPTPRCAPRRPTASRPGRPRSLVRRWRRCCATRCGGAAQPLRRARRRRPATFDATTRQTFDAALAGAHRSAGTGTRHCPARAATSQSSTRQTGKPDAAEAQYLAALKLTRLHARAPTSRSSTPSVRAWPDAERAARRRREARAGAGRAVVLARAGAGRAGRMGDAAASLSQQPAAAERARVHYNLESRPAANRQAQRTPSARLPRPAHRRARAIRQRPTRRCCYGTSWKDASRAWPNGCRPPTPAMRRRCNSWLG